MQSIHIIAVVFKNQKQDDYQDSYNTSRIKNKTTYTEMYLSSLIIILKVFEISLTTSVIKTEIWLMNHDNGIEANAIQSFHTTNTADLFLIFKN